MTGGGGGQRELDRTPTWAVASVCIVIIVISIILEKALHRLGHWFTEKRMKAMFEALEKVKAELMILGFISLLLTFGQIYISKICIPESFGDTMLPCDLSSGGSSTSNNNNHPHSDHNHVIGSPCGLGEVPLISTHGIHQLHIFIFFLAVFHVINSATTMALGSAKISGWKKWEAQSLNYEFSNDPSRFRFAQEATFVRQHTRFWDKNPITLYITSFFSQFFRSVDKDDYLTMRHGFIAVHLAPGSKFDFQKYIQRAMEDDFKVVVSISSTLWISVVLLLLFNVKGLEMTYWASFVPFGDDVLGFNLFALAVGTKLQAIITRMALEIKERHAVIQGVPLVTLGDDYFWFRRPGLVLSLIHFTLFQNAFQIIYFFWIWYSFGLKSCFHENLKHSLSRVCVGVGVQVLCSYVTLPLYALVSQMGSHLKRSIFDEHTSEALKKWQRDARKKCGNNSSNKPLSPTQIKLLSNRFGGFTDSAGMATAITRTRRRRRRTSRTSDRDEIMSETEVETLLHPSPASEHNTGETEEEEELECYG